MQTLEVHGPTKCFVHQREGNTTVQHSRPAAMFGLRGIQGSAALGAIGKERGLQTTRILGATDVTQLGFRFYANS